ncbi:MAG: hypothetical protein IJ593_01350, partial [Lachnospiraceae bacterium]|nr:hypothetical protein [Lachnospiraceae bacterium]
MLKRITSIILVIIMLLSINILVYADGGSGASGEATTYHGKGNVSYPNMVEFPLYHIIVCNGDNAVLVDEYVASNLVQTNGSSTVMGVADGTNRTMLWEATRTINIADTIKANGKELVYS